MINEHGMARRPCIPLSQKSRRRPGGSGWPHWGPAQPLLSHKLSQPVVNGRTSSDLWVQGGRQYEPLVAVGFVEGVGRPQDVRRSGQVSKVDLGGVVMSEAQCFDQNARGSLPCHPAEPAEIV